jgi:uncharacterized protein (TIGR01244 family)
MDNWIKLSEDITVGPQSTESELAEFARQGFKAVAHVRQAGEDNQPLSPEAEGEKVRALGMTYLHFPVSIKFMSADLVDRFGGELAKLPRPVLVHCGTGMRAGALCMMTLGAEQRMSGDEVLSQFECKQEELKTFIKNYLDSKQAQA